MAIMDPAILMGTATRHLVIIMPDAIIATATIKISGRL